MKVVLNDNDFNELTVESNRETLEITVCEKEDGIPQVISLNKEKVEFLSDSLKRYLDDLKWAKYALEEEYV